MENNNKTTIKITNIIALVLQCLAFIMLFLDSIKLMYQSTDYTTHPDYLSLGELSHYHATVNSSIGEKTFSGPSLIFVILVILFMSVIGIMIYEIAKEKLVFSALISSILFIVTEVYAFILYCSLSSLRVGVIAMNDSGKLAFYTKKETIGYLFLFCITIILVLKLINYFYCYKSKQKVAIDLGNKKQNIISKIKGE